MENEIDKNRKADEERIAKFRLMDDDFLSLCFADNKEATTLLLKGFLGREDIEAKEVISQKEIKNPNGHSVRLDIFAVDADGKNYDIEIQKATRGASKQRARYNSSMLDSRMLAVGEEYNDLKDSYVIFITENDVLGHKKPIYTINRYIEETNELFCDGSHIIYVNGEYQDNESIIGRLIHDFNCTDADEMYNSELAKRVRYFKETEGGRREMCKLMEDLRNETKIEMATALLKMGKLSNEEISTVSGLTIEQIEELSKKHNQAS